MYTFVIVVFHMCMYLEPLSLSEHFRVVDSLPRTRPTAKQSTLICLILQLIHLIPTPEGQWCSIVREV